MICHRCKCTTSQTHQETAGNAQVTWYKCPVCGHEQMNSQRIEERRAENRAGLESTMFRLRVGVGR